MAQRKEHGAWRRRIEQVKSNRDEFVCYALCSLRSVPLHTVSITAKARLVVLQQPGGLAV